ncbi:MAG: hypothetical protein JW765_12455 [Deltaproteobacteria bacterium]|nr:hypothetical protein [Candidatus Zymogenaceae bacterium]
MNDLMPIYGLRNLLDRTLAGERLTEGELTALTFEDRLRLIQRSPIRTKAHLIISSPDPVKILKKLSPQEIYLTVKESWGVDAAVILEMTAPDKIVQLLDMDIWKRDRIDFGKFMEWLQILSEGGGRVLTKSLFMLDEPLLILFFKAIIEVTSRNLDQDPLEFSDGGWFSFDNLYYFKPTDEEIDFDLVSNLLMQFFEYEPDYYRVIMEGIMGELPSPMEEDAYQLRSSRMSMIGFPELKESRELFLFEDPEKIVEEIRSISSKIIYIDDGQAGQLPPHYWLIPKKTGGFFEDLMGEAADDDDTAQVFWELSYLVHKVVAASGLDLSDVEELVASAQMAGDYINLGLEYLAGERHDEGKRIIREVYLVQLFRLGYTLALAERKKNEALITELSTIIDPVFWGDYTRNVVAGLLERNPIFYEGLTGGRADYRNFRSTADLKESADFMAQLSARVHLIYEIIDIPEDIGPWLMKNAKTHDWGLEHLFMTACVRACVSGIWEVAPLSTEDLARFYDMLKESPGITDGVIQEVEAFIQRMPESKDEKVQAASMKFVNATVTDFVNDMMRITDRDTIDERFVSGVITATPP